MAAGWAEAGFHGKLPLRGDFVTRRVPRALVEALDTWLQDGIAASRQVLGAGWLDLYLTSPVWRFTIDAGLVSAMSVAGVMIPSVDQVGRYFPLLILAPLGGAPGLCAAALAQRGWYARAQAAALLALQDDADFERFDAAVAALGAADGLQDQDALTLAVGGLVEGPVGLGRGYRCLWWTEGSDQVAPVMLAGATLPPAAGFASLLDGHWARLADAVSVHPAGGQP
ncbi:type VI secretion system-associated protein TagF [Azospirillum sp. A1-3]|uniref:type VI secretion system-associated protein TagF n=1 Tax=Azospirillum sp. A1-3 TaxID=185874 RepID=UPI002076EC17|nr:type VI secretion system-associated protein TagF [Azospirillum sp. A1-3]MCM8738886.1 type VI secretion system-associated protein TagF [Azospirillum sp. A1-3]